MHLQLIKLLSVTFDNLTSFPDSPVILSWTTYKQILPISLELFDLKCDLLKSSKTLKEIADQIKDRKQFFNCNNSIYKQGLRKCCQKPLLDNHKVGSSWLFLT